MALGIHSQQKDRKEGGGFVPDSTIFSAQSAWCLLSDDGERDDESDQVLGYSKVFV